MKSPATLKLNAQKILLTAWCESILILMISFCIYSVAISMYLLVTMRLGVFSFESTFKHFSISHNWIYISIAYLVGCKLLLIPLTYGIRWYYSMLKPNQTPAILSIFSCYKSTWHFFKTIKISLAVELRKMIVSVPLTILSLAYGAVFFLIYQNNENTFLNLLAFSIAIVLISINAFIYGVYKSRFLLVEYIYIINPHYSVKKIVNDSIKIVKLNKDYLLSVGASFVPWFTACIFVIPLIITVPYFSMVLSLSFYEMIENYNEEQLFANAEENIVASPALH